MKTKTILFVFASMLVTFFMAACNQNASKNTETTIDSSANKNLDVVFNHYWEERSKLFPFEATLNGDNRYNDQFPNDQTQSYRNTLKTFYQSYLDSAKSFDRSKLTDKNKISYDIFLYNMKMELKGLTFNTWMIPFDQFNGLPNGMALLGSGNSPQPFKTVQDYDNWLGRLKMFPVWADSAIGNFRQGMAAGVVLPKALVLEIIPQLESMVVTDPNKSLFYQPITHFPKGMPTADSDRLTAAYKNAVLTEIVPTYKKMADFLKNEYLPKARATAGISAIPRWKRNV